MITTAYFMQSQIIKKCAKTGSEFILHVLTYLLHSGFIDVAFIAEIVHQLLIVFTCTHSTTHCTLHSHIFTNHIHTLFKTGLYPHTHTHTTLHRLVSHTLFGFYQHVLRGHATLI